MIKLSKKELQALKNGEISSKEMALKLVQENSAFEIALAFVEELFSKELNDDAQVEKILVTQAEFDTHFRIKRPRKTKKEMEG
jgi:hypothetical protein